MIRFSATCFDGKSSRALAVSVEVDGETVRVTGRDSTLADSYSLWQCRLSKPPGKGLPALLLPGGGRCESEDRQAMTALAVLFDRSWSQKLVEHLERRWGLVMVCLAMLVLCCWLLINRGIPVVAKQVAEVFPNEVNEVLTHRVLEMMDHSFFLTSRLPEYRKKEVRRLFTQTVAESNAPFNFRLEFRNSPKVGANAFALPDGLVVVTDQLIDLVREDRELASIFVHERAHIENRHSLRSLLQNTGAFFLISALVGDVASITSTAATLPTLLLETGYSRAFEHDADAAVADYFVRHGWPSSPAVNILERLAASTPETAELPLISTHPLTRDRVKFLRGIDESY